MQRRIGVGWHELDMERAVSGLTATGLVIHDLEDLDVPIAEAQALADRWQGAKLYTTTGLGHRRILEDPAVVEEIATFFS